MMFHPLAKKTIPFAVTATLVAATAFQPGMTIASEAPAAIAAAATSVFQSPSLGKVMIGGTSYIEITNVQQLDTSVRFTVSVYNGGTTDLQFIDYWFKVRTAGGSQFSPKLVPADSDKNSISPKSTEIFTFYTTVNATTKITDLLFDVIKWDFSVPTYQRTLASLKPPAGFQSAAPAGAILSTKINDVASNFEIQRSKISKTSDKFIANLSMKLINTGTKSYVIPNYTYSIVTPEGLTYPLKVSGLPNNTTLTPRFNEEFSLSGELPGSLENENWKLVISESIDEKQSIPFASFYLPATSGETVGDGISYGSPFETLVSDQTIETTVTRMVRNENDVNYLATVTVTIVNQGSESVKLPNYTFDIRTSSGLVYPTTVDLKDVSINPLADEELVLKATVPVTAGSESWQLVMNEPIGEDGDEDESELAVFNLPDDNPTGVGQGVTYSYSNDSGTYDVTFTAIQRLPWEDQDVLSGEFTIKNTGSTALPVPDFQGHFMLDDNIEVEAKMVKKDAVMAIQPGQSIRTVLYGKIPYTYVYSTINLVLEEKIEDDTTINVAEFETGSEVADINVLPTGSHYLIEGAGRSAQVSVRSVRSYENIDNGNLYTTLVDVKNLEKRTTGITTFVGHYRTSDGLIFPVEFSDFSGKVSPQGTATLLASSVIPSTVNINGMQLVLGEGIAGGSEAATDAYMNAVAHTLPPEPRVQTNAINMELFPYTVSLKAFDARLETGSDFVFSFNYEVLKNSYVQNVTDFNHQLSIEFVDNNEVKFFTKTFTLGTSDSSENDTQLELGEDSKRFEMTDTSLQNLVPYVEDFEIRIYDEYEGVRKLIASIPYNWYD